MAIPVASVPPEGLSMQSMSLPCLLHHGQCVRVLSLHRAQTAACIVDWPIDSILFLQLDGANSNRVSVGDDLRGRSLVEIC